MSLPYVCFLARPSANPAPRLGPKKHKKPVQKKVLEKRVIQVIRVIHFDTKSQ
jgi:hypothetical protein